MRGRIAGWAATGLVAALFVTWAGYFIYHSSFVARDGERYFCLFDDAMISMRYAWNLAHGDGLVWNPGERVEGFTNPLMTLFMAGVAALFNKVEAVLVVQIAGIVFVLAGAFAASRIGLALLEGTPLAGRRGLGVLCFAAALAYYPLDYWSLMGMETGLLSALLLGGVWAAMAAAGVPRVRWAVPLLLGLAFLTRPDAAVAVGLVLVYRGLGIWRRPGWIGTLAIEGGLVAACVGAITVFRLAYYASAVPNTYVLKLTGMDLPFRIENGLAFIEGFIDSTAPLLALAVLAVMVDWRRRSALVLALVLGTIAYQVYVGGDAWVYWRMLAPVMPLLIVLVVAELALFVNARGERGGLARLADRRFAPPRAWLEALPVLIVVALLLEIANDRFEKEYWFDDLAYTVKSNRANVNVALALREVTRPTASVGVTWAGTIPYYTGLRAIDFLGKSDPYIARRPPDLAGGIALRGMKSLPGHNKYDLEYSIVKLKPTFVQQSKWAKQDVTPFVDEHYRRVRFKGVGLRLLEDSPDVRWDRLEADRSPGRSDRRRRPTVD